jgi:hypothetical protein
MVPLWTQRRFYWDGLIRSGVVVLVLPRLLQVHATDACHGIPHFDHSHNWYYHDGVILSGVALFVLASMAFTTTCNCCMAWLTPPLTQPRLGLQGRVTPLNVDGIP